MIKLSRTQVSSWRLSKNHLAPRAPKRDLSQVATDVCGVQAQVLSGAALSLWARVDNITIQDVEDALRKQRTLVKTWAMRGTLHLLSSNSLSKYVAALTTRQDRHSEMIKKRAGLRSRLDRSKPLVRPRSSRLTRRQDDYESFSGP